MKKRNFITGFSATFVALIALASCGGLRAKDGVVLTINGEPITAKELFEDQQTPAAAEAKFNAVYKVAVRKYFSKNQEGNIYMEEITRDTKNKVSGAKAEASSNASKNGTKYDAEWSKILSSNGVDSESGLYDKFEYDLQKAKFEEKIYDRPYDTEDGKTKGLSNYDVLRNGGFLKGNDGKAVQDTTKGDKEIPGYLTNKMPYHMKHILVKVSAKDNDDTSGEITAAEAKKLCDVITQLANGVSFDTIASSVINDDETARKNRGSLGIMSRDTEFVNDFKLGTYLFESYFARLTKDSTQSGDIHKPTNANKALFYDENDKQTDAGKFADKIASLPDPTALSSTTNKIGRIPYGAIKNLTKDTDDGCPLYEMDLTNGETAKRFAGVTDVKAKYYPRNVIFNKYFNKHNIMVITNSSSPTYDQDTASGAYISGTAGAYKKGNGNELYYENNHEPACDTSSTGYAGFKNNTSIKNGDDIQSFLGTTQKAGSSSENEQVLCDENGRIIFVFRSGTGSSNSSNASSGYQGIHFVVIERSPFITNEFDYSDLETTKTDETTLNQYYTEYYPGQTDGFHPKYTTEQYKNKSKKTYVNYIIGDDTAKLKDRAATVKSELKKADNNLNTYVYEYLMKKGQIVFNQSSEEAKKLSDSISNWINKTKRDDDEKSIKKKWNETWETYYDNLELRYQNRKHNTGKPESVAPEVLASVFEGKFKFKVGTTELTLNDVFGKGGAYNE